MRWIRRAMILRRRVRRTMKKSPGRRLQGKLVRAMIWKRMRKKKEKRRAEMMKMKTKTKTKMKMDVTIPMTLSEALTVPIYTPTTIPTDSDSEGEDEGGAGARPKIKLCILCPGKILKNEHMVKVHLDSGAHKRAAKRYSSYLSANPPHKTEDPRKIARSLVPSAPAPAVKSNKAKPTTTVETEEDKKGEKKKQPSKKGLNATARENRKQARVIAKIEERLAKGEVDPKSGEGMEGLNRKMRRELFRRLKTKEGEGHKEKKQKN
ncbi:hypothetical protein I309_00292 [Cryptococcus deuterogattii LA55]|nr:hypothetical protein I309_00292 [Cryptococcus deuterogattii LA55]KIR94969.1 hypothetical protein I304_01294 [Cryptococcus deuterogattii CBS 10090]